VTESCAGIQLPAANVQTAVATVPLALQNAFLGYQINGNLIQSLSLTTTVTPATPDRKLWIIGAVLGPVAFVLLLIGLCCFLHYKCRPRPDNEGFAQVYSYK
jgi:hypothetical protein